MQKKEVSLTNNLRYANKNYGIQKKSLVNFSFREFIISKASHRSWYMINLFIKNVDSSLLIM